MKRTKLTAATLGVALGFAITLSSAVTGLEGCSLLEKKVVTVADDVKTCFGPDVKGDIGDFVTAIGTALVCDITSGGSALPACAIEGLQTVAQEIGPSGEADVKCVVAKLATAATKAGASPEDAVRQQRARLIMKLGGVALLRRPNKPALSPRAIELLACDAQCGPSNGLPSPGRGCICWRSKLKTEHGTGAWVAAR